MIAGLAKRMVFETHPRLLWKFGWNFGVKGMLSVQRFKKRLKQGVHFPPFLFVSIINSCQLRCQGCWVDVEAPREMISLEDMNRVIDDAKKHGNSYFGLLGGEPFLHPQLFEILEAHPDCYFQIFTNGHFLTDEVCAQLRKAGNATPLISIEGTEIVSDERRGGKRVLEKSVLGIEACVRNRLITGVASSVCASRSSEASLSAPLRRSSFQPSTASTVSGTKNVPSARRWRRLRRVEGVDMKRGAVPRSSVTAEGACR